MSDLIDRQAVIDLLKQMRKDGDMVPWEGKDVFARIRKLPTIQPEPQWIPVERELPKEPGYYITSNEYNGVGEDFYYDGHFWYADKYAYSVIAWMPKPDHYKPNK